MNAQFDGPPEADDTTSARWVLAFVRPRWRRLLVALLLSLIGVAFSLVQPYVTKILIDDGLMAGNIRVLVWLSVAMVAAGVFSAAFGAWNRLYYVRVSADILFDMREGVYRHLQALSPAFYARRSAGDIISRLDGDVGEIQRFAVDGPLSAVNALIMLVGALAIMLQLSPTLSLLAFVLLPAQFFFLRRMRPVVERSAMRLRERAAGISSFLVQTLSVMKLVQSSAAEEQESRRLAGLNQSYLRDLLRLQIVNFVTSSGPGLMTSVSNAAVFVVGGLMVIDGAFTVGSLIAFTIYLGRATGPLQTLLGLYIGVQRAKVSLRRVAELLQEGPAVTAPAQPLSLPETALGEVRIEGVTLAYPERPARVLSDATLTIAAGSKVCIVGASGAGKSTLVDLLHRHYDPQAGRILLDDVDLRRLPLGELRRRVVVLGQEAAVMSASIADNICYGLGEVGRDRLRAAAAVAQIDAFVGALPQGYETPVGERGTALSGGQRQRIALARALLADPLVLILDEPVTGIDGEAAVRLNSEVDRLFAGRTRIIVSHRHEVLAGADKVVELRDGQLVEAAVPGWADTGT